MYRIEQVTTKKQLKDFVEFPLELYKGCEYFVPPFESDELKALNPKKSPYMGEDAIAQCFLCLDDNDKIVGRVCGIISNLYNEKTGEKRVRISRFDCINDGEVARLLFTAVEDWGREHEMTIIHGPLGFNDMEREGLLIEGFDLITTFNTQYYYPYYKDLFEQNGYVKEVDWLEYRFKPRFNSDERTAKLCDYVTKRLGIKELKIKNISWLVKYYYDQIFDVLDEAYGVLYGTISIKKEVRDSLVSQFKMVLNKDLMSVLVDKDGKVVGVGIVFPCLSQSLRDCQGKLFPFGWVKVLKNIKHFDVVEMALIGVRREYKDKALTSIIFHNILSRIKDKYPHIKFAETNLQLEDNYKVQQLFLKSFDTQQVRRRRCFFKSLIGEKLEPHKAIDLEAEIPEKIAVLTEKQEKKLKKIANPKKFSQTKKTKKTTSKTTKKSSTTKTEKTTTTKKSTKKTSKPKKEKIIDIKTDS